MKALILLLSLAMIPSIQAAQLTGTRGVSILAVDGSKIKDYFLSENETFINNGTHQIVAQFTAKRLPNDNENIIKSKPYIFNINVQGDTEITLKGLNPVYKSKAAIKNGLKWLVINDIGEITIKNAKVLQGTGVMPYADIEKLIVTYNKTTTKSIPEKAIQNDQEFNYKL